METSKNPAPRTPLHIQVEYRRNYARDNTNGTLKNVSVTGAFLQHTDEKLKVGDKLFLTFSVSSRERNIHAVVVWNNEVGAGVKFLPANNRDVQIVDDLIYYIETKRTGTRDVLDQIFKKVA